MTQNVASSRNVSEAFAPLLSELREKWVRDFLFSPHALHIGHLLSPTTSSNAFLFSFTATNAIPTVLAPLGQTCQINSDMLLLPAFTADHVTFGVGIKESRTSEDVSWLSKASGQGGSLMNVRFVHRPRNRSLFSVTDLVQENAHLLCIQKGISSTEIHYLTLIVQNETLRSASDLKEGALQMEDLLPGLKIAQLKKHTRHCVVCGSEPYARCDCNAYGNVPLHPFDSAFFAASLRWVLSTSESPEGRILWAYGRPHFQRIRGSRMSVRGLDNPSKVRDLTAWSISEYLKGCSGLPTQGILQTNGTDIEHSGHGLERAVQRSSIATDVRAGQAAIEDSEPRDKHDDRLNAPSFSIRYEDYWSNATSPLPCAQYPPQQASPSDVDNNNHAIELYPSTCQGFNAQGITNIDATGDTTGVSIRDPRGAQIMQHTRTVPLSNSAAHQAVGSSIPVAAPLLTYSFAQLEADTISPREIERQMRARERIERNREAARKSNEKRRVRREALKIELKEEQERLVELRERETELRQENQNLRAAIEKSGTKIVMSTVPASLSGR